MDNQDLGIGTISDRLERKHYSRMYIMGNIPSGAAPYNKSKTVHAHELPYPWQCRYTSDETPDDFSLS
jgi:hypothetical protein